MKAERKASILDSLNENRQVIAFGTLGASEVVLFALNGAVKLRRKINSGRTNVS